MPMGLSANAASAASASSAAMGKVKTAPGSPALTPRSPALGPLGSPGAERLRARSGSEEPDSFTLDVVTSHSTTSPSHSPRTTRLTKRSTSNARLSGVKSSSRSDLSLQLQESAREMDFLNCALDVQEDFAAVIVNICDRARPLLAVDHVDIAVFDDDGLDVFDEDAAREHEQNNDSFLRDEAADADDGDGDGGPLLDAARRASAGPMTVAEVVLASRESLVINNFEDYPDVIQPVITSLDEVQTAARVIAVPVWAGEKMRGVLMCALAEPTRLFTEMDVKMMTKFNRYLSITLQNCLTVRELGEARKFAQRTADRGKMLLEITRVLNAPNLRLSELRKLIMEACQPLMGAERCTIFLVSRDRQRLKTQVRDTDSDDMMEISIPVTKGIAGHVALHGEVVNVADAYTDDRFDPTVDQQTGFRTRSILCTPLLGKGGEVIGVTQLINKADGSVFTPGDERLLREFNSQASLALQNCYLHLQEINQKRFMQSILSSISSWVIVFDKHGKLVTSNRSLRKMFHAPVKTMETQSYREWMAESNYDMVDEVTQSNLAVSPSLRGRGLEKMQRATKKLLATLSIASSFSGSSPNLPRPGNSSGGGGSLKANRSVSDSAIPSGNKINAGVARMLARSRRVGNMERFHYWQLRADLDFVLEAQPAEHGRPTSISRSGYEIQTSRDRSVRINYTAEVLQDPATKETSGAILIVEDISKENHLRQILSKYMAPQLAEKVLADGGVRLGGVRQYVTTMFCDIRNFTSQAERMPDPTEVVTLLNEYFGYMVSAIVENGGLLEKYIGDATMAVFGVPFSKTDDTQRACRAALAMLANLEIFNASRRERGLPEIHNGIGLCTGMVLSGNIGTPERLEYTVIGDNVNLASRLEAMTKTYGVPILLAESTQNDLDERFVTREIDNIRVPGKSDPARIYELMWITDAEQDADVDRGAMDRLINAYQRGLQFYRQTEWDRAEACFQQCVDMVDDPPAMVMLRRISRLRLDPPDIMKWDGVWDFVHK